MTRPTNELCYGPRVQNRSARPLVWALLLASIACSESEAPEPAPPPPPTDDPSLSLHQRFADYFAIGAAVDAGSTTTHAELLTPHFNSITAENEMKFDALHPSEDSFQFDTADAIVGFAGESPAPRFLLRHRRLQKGFDHRCIRIRGSPRPPP